MANLNINKTILGGRLTADPELKTTPSGVSVTSFTVAVNRRYTKEGEQQQADFINCVAWRQTADFICKYFRKASSICIVGEIQTRTWTDQNGQKRYATEVIASEAYFVDAKSDSGSTAPASASQYVPDQYKAPQNAPEYTEISGEDNLPF